MARVYLMNMLFNLNMRGSGGFVMLDPSNHSRSHRPSGSLAHTSSLPLGQIHSSTGHRLQHSIVHVSQSVQMEVDHVSRIRE